MTAAAATIVAQPLGREPSISDPLGSHRTESAKARSDPWSRFATTVLRQTLGLRRGQSVWIETWSHALAVAEIVATTARRLGIHPTIKYRSEISFFETEESPLSHSGGALARGELAGVQASDACLFLPGPEDLKRFEWLPIARKQAYFRREGEFTRALQARSIPGAYLVGSIPTAYAAREFGVSLQDWQRETLAGTATDPRVFRRTARRLIGPLLGGHRITITHSNGTHLELGLEGRRPILDDGTVDAHDLARGRVWTAIPSGVLVTAIDPGVAEGRFISNRPFRHRRGVVEGTRWTFRGGRLIHLKAAIGDQILLNSYRRAGRERDRPALLEIGLNPNLHVLPFGEDQELGVVSVLIGHNDDLGGRTRGAYREYASLQGADVSVDGRPILIGGQVPPSRRPRPRGAQHGERRHERRPPSLRPPG